MKIKFLGAAGCVSGSCHLITIEDKKILLDCGLFQGKDAKDNENEKFHFNPKDIDAVILSHAHMDHSGRIPLLYKLGFRGPVICTNGTKDLCSSMLIDCANIFLHEVSFKNKKREKKGLPLLKPLYEIEEVEGCLKLFKGYGYEEEINLFPNITLTLKDAGHLLGSALCEILVNPQKTNNIKLIFSGDIGNVNLPILKDPEYIVSGDYVIMETTYGAEEHKDIKANLHELVEIIKQTIERKGNVIIPSFSVGKTQEVIYALNKYIENGEIKNCKVYVDSPLASKTTEIFKKYEEYFDMEAKALIEKGDDPLVFKELNFTESVEDSVNLKKINSGLVIIAASGMCEGGRVIHHLKNNLNREECSVVFVGYQAEGTLGKKILGGERKVSILGEEIAVKAQIYTLEGLSGHADKNVLLAWLEKFSNKPKKVFLVHGEGINIKSFNREITLKGYNSIIPAKNQEFNIEG